MELRHRDLAQSLAMRKAERECDNPSVLTLQVPVGELAKGRSVLIYAPRDFNSEDFDQLVAYLHGWFQALQSKKPTAD